MIEYRTVGGSATAEGNVLRGLVTPFNVWTTIGDPKRGGFKERSAPGSFTKTLQERDVVLIDAHDTSKPMARTSIKEGVGSLSLREDVAAGLRAEAIPVDTSYARDVMACASAGVTRGMSYGFEVIKDSWTDDEGRASDAQRGTKRTIHEVRLHEVTTTAFPAYETTELAVRDSINAARGVAQARAAKSEETERSEIPAEVRDAMSLVMQFFNAGGMTSGNESGGQASESDGTDAVAESASHSCPVCGMTCGDYASPDNPGADGDADSDADDQVIDRSTEPVDTTPGEAEDAEYRARLSQALKDYLRTR